MSDNSFNTRQKLSIADTQYEIFNFSLLPQASKLPFCLKILLENLLRYEDDHTVTKADIQHLLAWDASAPATYAISFRPARVLLQDFTGVPAVVDLATMRETMEELGGDPSKIRPLQPVELVIDHSVQVDNFGTSSALDENSKIEYQRNQERYTFLKWGQEALDNFAVVPPGSGIVHQINLEKLARVVFSNDSQQAYFDTVVGTDSHTTMVNGLGVLGWGVGGIEAEASMLGQPISMLIPRVVGFEITGNMPEGTTATDLVLVIVEMLRNHGVVGKFVEFYGSGIVNLSLADRATIANMAPEYGATCGLFPIDEITLAYLRLTNRSEAQITLIEQYARATKIFNHDYSQTQFSEHLSLNISTIVPSIAGPKRPQDRIDLSNSQQEFQKYFTAPLRTVAVTIDGQDCAMTEGDVVIAAITSCTNTSNPAVLVAAGLVAKKAVQLGLQRKPWVKTSLAPGSQVVTAYLQSSGLLTYLEQLQFNVAGYGCTTCIGNSGPLPTQITNAIVNNDLTVAAVLSGNRNFEGRVHQHVKMNYLASPPLVVIYALAGTMNIDLMQQPLGSDRDGNNVFMKDIWPNNHEISAALQGVQQSQFAHVYDNVFAGDGRWQSIKVASAGKFEWDENSTYVRKPNFFDGISEARPAIENIQGARALALLGDSVTTDHISPAGNIQAQSPAGKYLQEKGAAAKDFNSYGSRRGNHEIMVRGTFANIRIKNQMLDGVEGGMSVHIPSGEQMTIYDVAMKYRASNTPAIIIAGKEYGTGSSRDWAAKGPYLLGIQAVIAESFERIHRTNLVGMGILPLEFTGGATAKSLELTAHESFTIAGIDNGTSKTVQVTATAANGKQTVFTAKVRIDTPQEIDYFQDGGILHYVLKSMLKKAA